MWLASQPKGEHDDLVLAYTGNVPRKPAAGGIGRYDLREIGARVDRKRLQVGMEVKQVCSLLKPPIDKTQWSKKVRARGSSFTVEELGQLADLFTAPPGWPFVSEDVWSGKPSH